MSRPPGSVLIALAVVFGVLTVGVSSRMLLSIQNWLLTVVPFAVVSVVCAVRIAAWCRMNTARYRQAVDHGTGGRRWPRLLLWVLGVAFVSYSGLARTVRWRFDEPRLRAEAMQVLANPPPGPPPEFGHSEKSVGTLVIWRAFVENGRVHLSTRQTDGMFNFAELVYSPPGTAPPPWSTDLGGGWSVRETSTVH